MKRNFILLSVLGMAVLLVLSASSVFSGKSKGNSNEPPPEYIIYTYELKGEELAALKQRYWAADEATREELCWEIGRLLGYSNNIIRLLSIETPDNPRGFDSMMKDSLSINVSISYLVSYGDGSIESVTKEEAYQRAAEVNAAREAEFQAQIQKLIGK